jgi:hypothetical protein
MYLGKNQWIITAPALQLVFRKIRQAAVETNLFVLKQKFRAMTFLGGVPEGITNLVA